MARDEFLGFALEGSEALDPAALASTTVSANPYYPYPLVFPLASTLVAAAAAEYRRGRGDHAHRESPGHHGEAATTVVMPRQAAYPAACPDVTTW